MAGLDEIKKTPENYFLKCGDSNELLLVSKELQEYYPNSLLRSLGDPDKLDESRILDLSNQKTHTYFKIKKLLETLENVIITSVYSVDKFIIDQLIYFQLMEDIMNLCSSRINKYETLIMINMEYNTSGITVNFTENDKYVDMMKYTDICFKINEYKTDIDVSNSKITYTLSEESKQKNIVFDYKMYDKFCATFINLLYHYISTKENPIFEITHIGNDLAEQMANTIIIKDLRSELD